MLDAQEKRRNHFDRLAEETCDLRQECIANG